MELSSKLGDEEILKRMPVWYPKVKEIHEDFFKEEALRTRSKTDASHLCS